VLAEIFEQIGAGPIPITSPRTLFISFATASEEWTRFLNKQPVESQNGKRMDSTSDYGGPQ
jgi:hypothetical protein